MTPISYRCATHEDIKQLNDLRIASYSEFEKSLPRDGWAILNASLHDNSKLKEVLSNSRAFVGEVDGSIVGMAFLVSNGNPTTIYPAEWSYIRMVGVHPDFRGKGIGKKLTCMCIDNAREKGEKIIGLHTSEVMDNARHIYESLGFTVYKEIDRIFGVRYWLYKMNL
ncbi:MAG: N-acetyltransferase [Chitinophagaceae bacterium]|nr:MAG: N-acetyltransferase [Chitinophagaceae bacterium]